MTEPLDADALFGAFAGARGLVLAVSGGPDSTALMHLAAAWQDRTALPLWVATVDHGLQPGSAAVAAAVLARAAVLGLPGRLLRWEGEKPSHGVQDAARQARYGLLRACAENVGASHIVTAHTRDDQAETVLIRLAAGSGPGGLAGMRPSVALGGLVLARPFLGVAKTTLIDLCLRHGWPFSHDPANTDPRYARARWRSLAPLLAAEGLTARRLARLAERAARADAALDGVASVAAARCRVGGDHPEVHILDAAALLTEPDEIVLRVLARSLRAVGGAERLRLQRLERLLAMIRHAAARRSGLHRTLAGCLVEYGPDRLVVRPEPPRRSGPRAPAAPPTFRSR